jgi:soluble lytic murein transglycosylase-like protein
MALPTNVPATLQAQAWTPADMDRLYQVELAQKRYWQAEREAARVFKRNGVTDKFAGLVAESSLAYGVRPRVLAALIVVESHGNPHAISSAGAVGLTQIHLKTWHLRKDDMLVPEKNVHTGARILASYTKRYGLREGLHAYNGLGGEEDVYANRVLTAMAR